MVSLDNSVLARIEKGGKRYEALVDPDQIEEWKIDPSKFDLDDVMAMDEIFHDARSGERPTEEILMKTFDTLDVGKILMIILKKGSIQLTTSQRKARVATMRQQIIHHIQTQAIDPTFKIPPSKNSHRTGIGRIKIHCRPLQTFRRSSERCNR